MDQKFQTVSNKGNPHCAARSIECCISREEFGPMGGAPLSLPHAYTMKLNECETLEKKLEYTLQFMQEALTNGGGQCCKEFWEARKLCIMFFKEPLRLTARIHLWSTYSELCREARRLKELVDEDNILLVEQMEKGITAAKEEIHLLSTRVNTSEDVVEIAETDFFGEKRSDYQQFQKELTLLDACAEKTGVLRKEIVQADMKLRSKNVLFQQLCTVGELVFPKRKELVQKISQLYLSDVEKFTQKTPLNELSLKDLFSLQDQLKKIQRVGTRITLHSDVFNKTRIKLSEYWDTLARVIREKKRMQAEVRHEKKQKHEEKKFRKMGHQEKREVVQEKVFLNENVSDRGKQKEALLQQKQEVKARLEALRKKHRSSLSDISNALELDEKIQKEKEMLQRIEESLDMIENGQSACLSL